MMYKAVRDWRDLEDGHLYQAGDRFPHDGREVSEQRISALRTGQNLASLVMIEEVEETIAPKTENAENAKKTASNAKPAKQTKKAVKK